ncbi:GNAT family N-acetyltransferase [Corynebacterium timonense]|uniref:N-acetyltransferase domain-containing protein n=1 Tax=Corynebacterium timonense TaxID=441500 RepID=A0A1H1LC71_9CORY|nr:GNAT family N-acetyltransferase [Corynebacterium timonense]SDR72093.1 hypothetical protein SAMN04488539_0153 [Corynebacterium timonense]
MPENTTPENTTPELRVNEREGQYEIYVGDTLAGYATYVDRGAARVLPHTVVFDAFQGQGLSKALIAFALDDVAAAGRTVVPQCSAVAHFIEKNPEYADLVDTGGAS